MLEAAGAERQEAGLADLVPDVGLFDLEDREAPGPR